MTSDLEFLREVFKDTRLHFGVGVVKTLGLANDGSLLRVKVLLIPENREVIVEMTFSDVCSVTFPEVDDLALVAFAEGHPDGGYIIKLVNNTDEPIPLFARSSHTTQYSRPGKKLYVGSDTKVGLGRKDIEPTEPLVLGNVAKTFLTAVLDEFLNAPQIGLTPFGPCFLDPTIRANLIQLKQTYLTDASTNIVSQIAFSERGV